MSGNGAIKGGTSIWEGIREVAPRAVRAARGIPVVTVLVSGRPLVVNEELAASSGFVAAGRAGSEGSGVADVLFGDRDFQGRLPFAWPAAMRGSPDANGDAPEGPRVLFPWGYGLGWGKRPLAV